MKEPIIFNFLIFVNFQQIVIGCDGIRSPIAKWMGFPEPMYVGHYAFRGLAFFPGGHPFEPRLNQIYGRGQRAGIVPISRTKVYWFICFNSPSPGKLPSLMYPFYVSVRVLTT